MSDLLLVFYENAVRDWMADTKFSSESRKLAEDAEQIREKLGKRLSRKERRLLLRYIDTKDEACNRQAADSFALGLLLGLELAPYRELY